MKPDFGTNTYTQVSTLKKIILYLVQLPNQYSRIKNATEHKRQGEGSCDNGEATAEPPFRLLPLLSFSLERLLFSPNNQWGLVFERQAGTQLER